MPALQIEEVTTSDGLDALAPAWGELWQRDSAATPFQSPAWLISWWREIGGGELRVLTAWASGRLIGLLPMYLQDVQAGRKLLPLGIAISDYLDGLFEDDVGVTAAETMLRHLTDRDDWQRCELHPLRSGSPLLEARAPPECTDQVLEFEPCLVLEVPTEARCVRDVVSGGMRRKLRQAELRAERAGRIRFQTATATTVPELLEAFFRLHAARWTCRDAPGVLVDPAIRRFHSTAAPLLLGAGLLRLHALRLNERIVAVVYALFAKRRAYSYLGGFDPEVAAISPGTLSVGLTIEQAVREGACEIDFLRGREGFKYRWGARERPCYGRMLNRAG